MAYASVTVERTEVKHAFVRTMPKNEQHMNITTEQFVRGFEQGVSRLASVLDEWDEIDEDLREHYCEEFEWMIQNERIVIENSQGADRTESRRAPPVSPAPCPARRPASRPRRA
jgi:hypothetical protein